MTENELNLIREFTSDIPVRLAELASALGLEVRRASLKPNISGQIEPSESSPSSFVIRLNKHEKPERQRFTLAHEIAHFLLHRQHIGRGVFDSVMYRSKLHSRHEVEANKLAAELVMPAKAIQDELRKLEGPVDELTAIALAEKFRVSLPAMKIRLGLK